MHAIVKFETRYPVGKDPQDWVLLAPRGEGYERTQTWHRVKSIMPPEGGSDRGDDHIKTQQARWETIQAAYEAWKSGNELPTDGTPLEAWGGVNKGQIETLKRMGIRTIEGLRDINDKAIAQLNWPDARRMPKLAGAFLESADVAEKDRELADMRERMQVMEEMLADATEPPKKRGRPPKAKPDESEAA